MPAAVFQGRRLSIAFFVTQRIRGASDNSCSFLALSLFFAGRTAEAAALWEAAASEHREDPDLLAARLADLMETVS